jgi:hypothetical protein
MEHICNAVTNDKKCTRVTNKRPEGSNYYYCGYHIRNWYKHECLFVDNDKRQLHNDFQIRKQAQVNYGMG